MTLFLVLAMVLTLLTPQVLATGAGEGDDSEALVLPEFMYGDLDGDEKVTSIDYSIIMKHILYEERLLPGSWQFKVADVSGDNLVDTIDAALVSRYILEVISKFPAEDKEEDPDEPKVITEKPIPLPDGLCILCPIQVLK